MTSDIKQRIEQIKRGEVPQGYKKTEVGIVPQEWEDKTIGQIGKFSKGKGIPGTEMKSEGLPCIGYGDIYTKYNYKFYKTHNFVDDEIAKESTKAEKGAIFFTCSGETAIEIGKCVCYTGDDPIYVGGDIAILKTNKQVDPLFLAYQQNIPASITKKAQYGQGHSVVHIYSDSLSKLWVAYPKELNEQQTIAEILAKWDEAIALQEKLIEKLEEQKKALMQKLLTTKEGWKKIKLGDICKITTGKLDVNAAEIDGKYPFFTCAKERFYINEYAFDIEAILISGNGANVGYVHYYNGKFNAYQRTYVLTDFADNIHYVKLFLDMFLKKQIDSEKNEGNTPYIVLSTLSKMNIYIPNENIDKITKSLKAENLVYDLQNQKLQKLKQQQKAMQQLLLTGIVRV